MKTLLRTSIGLAFLIAFVLVYRGHFIENTFIRFALFVLMAYAAFIVLSKSIENS